MKRGGVRRNSEPGQRIPAGPDRDVGSRHRAGPQGRRLREEAGLAHRGRAGRPAVLPQGGAGGLEDQVRTAPDQYPFVRGTGESWEMAQDAKPGPQAIRADLLHEAGAHAVQELGYGIAAGVERLAELTAKLPVDTIAAQIEFVFAVGPSYFVEIAKLRAARMLWAQAVIGIRSGGRSAPAACACTCARRGAIRASTTGTPTCCASPPKRMAAAVGGCDRLTVEPFGFDAHLALNVQRILKEESHLDAVADPGGRVLLHRSADGRAGARSLETVPAGGSGRRVRQGAGVRLHRKGAGGDARGPGEGVLRAAARAGGRQQLSQRGGEDARGGTAGAGSRESAWPSRSRRSGGAPPGTRRPAGRYPKVLLLKRGDVKMKGARSNFCLNFFGCAGFDMVESEEYEGTDADLIVLCSSDPEYLALAQEVCPQ